MFSSSAGIFPQSKKNCKLQVKILNITHFCGILLLAFSVCNMWMNKSLWKPYTFTNLFIYLGFYIAFNTVQVISRRVVGRAEETSTYSSLGFCTVNCRPTASNYQLSHLRPCRESNPGLRSGRWECYHSATMAPNIYLHWGLTPPLLLKSALVKILHPDSDLDHHQNHIICSLSHCWHFQKIS